MHSTRWQSLARSTKTGYLHATLEICDRSTRPAKQNLFATGATCVPAEHSWAENPRQEGSTHKVLEMCQRSTRGTQQTLGVGRQPPASRRWPRSHSMARQMCCTPCTPSAVPPGNAYDSGLCSNIGSYCIHLVEVWVDCSAGRIRRPRRPSQQSAAGLRSPGHQCHFQTDRFQQM